MNIEVKPGDGAHLRWFIDRELSARRSRDILIRKIEEDLESIRKELEASNVDRIEVRRKEIVKVGRFFWRRTRFERVPEIKKVSYKRHTLEGDDFLRLDIYPDCNIDVCFIDSLSDTQLIELDKTNDYLLRDQTYEHILS